jgi:two-component system sensor histidine kinase KdpD
VLALRAANAHATALQALGRQLAVAADLAQVIAAGRRVLRQATDAETLVLVGNDVLDPGGTGALGDKDRAAADWALRHRQPAGRFTDTLGNAGWWFLPLGDDVHAGLIGLRFPEHAPRPGPEQRRLIEAMADDIAQAIVRTRLVSDLEDARVTGETERLRSALLSSVSHDLRSPLASIIGAAESLDRYGAAMSETDRHDLLDTVRQEGARLDRCIQNLLDMTRIGHGGLALNRDWIGVDELIGSAIARLQRERPDVRFELHLADTLAPVWVHPALVEQALFNVIENAARFSPPGESVTIDARDVEAGLRIDVRDRGPGIPEDERQRIFDMFYSVERGDRGRSGTGLGLAITRGMIGAHGGSAEAMPGHDGRGTTIRIELPRVSPASGD